jgi:hypothetical protein
MGIDDRPLPKPPVVKFAAVVTTAAFAGYYCLFLNSSIIYLQFLFILSSVSIRNTTLFNIIQRQQRRARLQLGVLVVCYHFLIAVPILCRFIKKWIVFWPHFGDYLLPNQESHKLTYSFAWPGRSVLLNRHLFRDSILLLLHWPRCFSRSNFRCTRVIRES